MLLKRKQAQSEAPSSGNLADRVKLLLEKDGIIPRRLQEEIASLIRRRPRNFALDPATAVRSDVQIYLDQSGAEARWRGELEDMHEDFFAGLTSRVLGRITMYAEELGANLSDTVKAVDKVLATYCTEAAKKEREAETKAQEADRVLRRHRDAQADEGSNTLWGNVLSAFGAVADGPKAVAAWNLRESETFHMECAQFQLAAWEALRKDLQLLPAKIRSLGDVLTSELQTASVSDVPREELPMPRHAGISWEPIAPLVEWLTQRDVNAAFPDDLLAELLEGEDIAIDLLDRDVRMKAICTANEIAIGGLQRVHGALMRDAARQMLRCMNDGAGKEPMLFQIGEKHPDTGEVSFVWRPIRQQIDVLATDGLSLAVGFIRIDEPSDVSQVFGSSVADGGSPNPAPGRPEPVTSTDGVAPTSN